MKFGLVSDPRFIKHECPTRHVERPERLEAILEQLKGRTFATELTPFPLREATDEELLRAHQPSVVEAVRALTEQGGGNLDPDTYLNEHSDLAARLAVGSGIDLCRAVLKGELDRGFVLARPPGHHATPSRSMVFCLYSTVALVALACRDLAERVLIFDWDVHHGNGTQDCLYDNGDTCFLSFHQGRFYPGTGYPDERGAGPGEGLTYNLPLPAGCGDDEYVSAYYKIVRPILRRYDPQLIIVSAGYDAHKDDLLGGMTVTAEGFARLAQLVQEDAEATSAQGRLVGFLEGGYHLGGLADSVMATLDIWTGTRTVAVPEPHRIDPMVQKILVQAQTRFEE